MEDDACSKLYIKLKVFIIALILKVISIQSYFLAKLFHNCLSIMVQIFIERKMKVLNLFLS